MKRFLCVVALILLSVPAWSAAKKVTIAELTDMLKSMQQQKKSDADVSATLKQVQLSEAMTRSVMNGLSEYVPGPASTEQIYVLEARSALLPPPAADIPATPAPDAAAQKALLDKAADYASKTYAQLPAIAGTKTTVRFQDNIEAPASSSGLVGGASEVTTGSNFVNASQFIRYVGSTESHVESNNGAEKVPAKDKTRWGANGQIALLGQGPVLSTVLREAQDSGTFGWLGWENVNGKPAAVFSYAVPKKKSHYAVDYCCFPDVSQTGKATFQSAAIGGAAGTGGGGASGNLQTTTDWHDYKANSLPYHGELFIDPDTGIVVRLITSTEFKNTDVVHQEDERIDYGPVTLGGKPLVLPVKTVISTEVVPNGDSGSAGKYSTRHTLLTSEYKDYQLAGATAQK
jgi:hypothetical protein